MDSSIYLIVLCNSIWLDVHWIIWTWVNESQMNDSRYAEYYVKYSKMATVNILEKFYENIHTSDIFVNIWWILCLRTNFHPHDGLGYICGEINSLRSGQLRFLLDLWILDAYISHYCAVRREESYWSFENTLAMKAMLSTSINSRFKL